MLLLNSTLHMVTNIVFPVFPVQISIYNLGEEFHEMNEQLVEDSFIEKNRHSHGELMSNKGGWHSSFGMEDRYNSFNNFKPLLKSAVMIIVIKHIINLDWKYINYGVILMDVVISICHIIMEDLH